jgi:hypothetical protein
MPRWLYFLCDLVAISVLAFAVYFPRYRRRDLVVAYVAVNVGVMAVIVALTSSMEGVGVGVGFGLFGVLSIVRLRSSELAQQELAYYFVALSLGLMGGLEITPAWIVPALSAAMVAIVAVADHPRLFARYRQQVLTLDRAFPDESALVRHLESMLNAQVRHVQVLRTDLVNDTTVVDARYRLLEAVPAEPPPPPPPPPRRAPAATPRGPGTLPTRVPVKPVPAHSRPPNGAHVPRSLGEPRR